MRLKIHAKFNGELTLPMHYSHILQAFIINILASDEIRAFIHDKGFNYEKRVFKSFTFSNIYGHYKIMNKSIRFTSPISFIISASWNDFVSSFIDGIMRLKEFRLGHNIIEIDSLEIQREPIFESNTTARTLTPITVYSTIEKNGVRRTLYYDCYDDRFSELIRNNLIKKVSAIYRIDLANQEFSIFPAKDKCQQKYIKYKDFLIKAWAGEFVLSGNKEFMRAAYELGLGAKNSQGFGCIEFV